MEKEIEGRGLKWLDARLFSLARMDGQIFCYIVNPHFWNTDNKDYDINIAFIFNEEKITDETFNNKWL